jgi:hypothetical protein
VVAASRVPGVSAHSNYETGIVTTAAGNVVWIITARHLGTERAVHGRTQQLSTPPPSKVVAPPDTAQTTV